MQTLWFEKRLAELAPEDVYFLMATTNRREWRGFPPGMAGIMLHTQPASQGTVMIEVSATRHPALNTIDYHWLDLGTEIFKCQFCDGVFKLEEEYPEETWRDRPPLL